LNGFSTLPRPIHLAMGSLARRVPRAAIDWPLVSFWAAYIGLLSAGTIGLMSWL
jgi:hypothetical protein